MLRRIACMLAIAGWLVGCATEPVALKSEAIQEMQSVDTVLLVPKERTDVTVSATNIGGGLLDQLVAAYIDKKRQEGAAAAASPIVDALQSYDFRAAMRAAWARAFTALPAGGFRVPPAVDTTPAGDRDASRRAWFDRTDAQAVMFADIDHTLQSGSLLLTATVEVYPKAAALMKYRTRPAEGQPLDEGNALYRNRFAVKRDFITANNVRSALDEGVAELARRVAADLGGAKP